MCNVYLRIQSGERRAGAMQSGRQGSHICNFAICAGGISDRPHRIPLWIDISKQNFHNLQKRGAKSSTSQPSLLASHLAWNHRPRTAWASVGVMVFYYSFPFSVFSNTSVWSQHMHYCATLFTNVGRVHSATNRIGYSLQLLLFQSIKVWFLKKLLLVRGILVFSTFFFVFTDRQSYNEIALYMASAQSREYFFKIVS